MRVPLFWETKLEASNDLMQARLLAGHSGLHRFRASDSVYSYWVAVKELNLSYHIGETLLFTIYIYIYTPILVTAVFLQ